MTLDVDPAIVSATTVTNKRCSFYDGNPEATGASWIGAGRGMVAMSNIFIQNSLLFLATNAASCWDDGASEENESTCTKKVFGMVPSTLLTNIVTVAGLLSAFLMPICGAIVDFTPHRRLVGIFASVILTLIQGIQIYTVESTWFIMGFLQAIAVVLYQFIIVASISYLPGIARKVQQTTMNKYTSNLIVFQFGAQLTFAAIINGVTIALKTNAVRTAQISQTVNTVTCIILFGVGWIYYMTNKPAVRELPPGRNLLTERISSNLADGEKHPAKLQKRVAMVLSCYCLFRRIYRISRDHSRHIFEQISRVKCDRTWDLLLDCPSRITSRYTGCILGK